MIAHILREGVAIRPDDHAAAHRRIVGQFGAQDYIGIPARKIIALISDVLDIARSIARGCLRFGHQSYSLPVLYQAQKQKRLADPRPGGASHKTAAGWLVLSGRRAATFHIGLAGIDKPGAL